MKNFYSCDCDLHINQLRPGVPDSRTRTNNLIYENTQNKSGHNWLLHMERRGIFPGQKKVIKQIGIYLTYIIY